MPSGISSRHQSTRFMSLLRSTLSCTTVCRAIFTPKWSDRDPEKPETTGHLLPDILWTWKLSKTLKLTRASTSVVPTAKKPVPRTKLSSSLWFGTSLKLILSGISPRPRSTRLMSFLSSTRSCSTVCCVLPKWSERDPKKPERTGHLLPDILWRLPWTTRAQEGPMLTGHKSDTLFTKKCNKTSWLWYRGLLREFAL